MSIQLFFHPQDILAMGLVMCSLACVRRGQWFWAGVLIALAITSQQFSLLVAAPLLVVTPSSRQKRFVGGALAAIIVVVGPIGLLTSGLAIKSALIGSGTGPAFGGTVLTALPLHGPVPIIMARLFPIILATILAWWAEKHLGSRILEPVPLVSLMATTMSFRLIFEVNLFGYYFMAVTVLLIVLDVLSGRIRWNLLAWLVVVSAAFDSSPWWHDPIQQSLPSWLWQLILTATAVAMAVSPLRSAVQEESKSTSVDQSFA